MEELRCLALRSYSLMRDLRMLALRTRALLAFCLSISPMLARGQIAVAPGSRVQGTVIDDQSGAPLANVSVEVSRGLDTLARVVTDEVGHFRTLPLADGALKLTFRRLGYQSGTLSLDVLARRKPVEVAMAPVAKRLEDITVVSGRRLQLQSALRNFDTRAQHKAGGTYFGRADLDKLHAARLSDLMRRVPGVRLVDSSGVLLVASSRGYKVDMKRGESMAPCVMRIGVDGQIKEPGYSINSIDPLQVYGVEVYSGPSSIPAEFDGLRTDAFCGLVLIWTRIE